VFTAAPIVTRIFTSGRTQAVTDCHIHRPAFPSSRLSCAATRGAMSSGGQRSPKGCGGGRSSPSASLELSSPPPATCFVCEEGRPCEACIRYGTQKVKAKGAMAKATADASDGSHDGSDASSRSGGGGRSGGSSPLVIPRSCPRSARPPPLPELKPRPTHPPVVDLRYVHSASSLLAYLGRLSD
jgi:hypothetical protein